MKETPIVLKNKESRQVRHKARKQAKKRAVVKDAIAKKAKKAEIEQLKRLNISPKDGTVQVAPAVQLYKKCKFPLCVRLVDEQGYPPYCTMVCQMFHRKQQRSLSTYDPTYATDTIWEYLRHCEASHTTRFMKIGDNMVPIKNIDVPSIAGFAIFLGVPKSTLNNWSRTHNEFREALIVLKQTQEAFLLNKGLNKLYDPQMSKFILMNNHGMKEKAEKTVNNLFGVVREVYEKADAYDQEGIMPEDPFSDENSDESIKA